MKKTLALVICTFIVVINSFGQYGYRFQKKEIKLKTDSSMYFIQIIDEQRIANKNEDLKQKEKNGDVKLFHKLTNNSFLIYGNNFQHDSSDYFSNVYRTVTNDIVIILPRIVVSLKTGENIEEIIKEYPNKLEIESGNKEKWILKCICTKSEEVLKLVNEISNKTEVDWCEPELFSEIKLNNTFYPQQYYLNNTGQNGGVAGIDINVVPAWAMTNGCTDLTVAIIDEGVDKGHEDFGNRVLDGYTIGNSTGLGAPQNVNVLNPKGHGIACAGIVAASNNAIGIRGIASNIKILPVNIVPNAAYQDIYGRIIAGYGSNIEIARAINWAWRRADILSNSWGGGAYSNEIVSAIDSARTHGRNGKGAIVVFASGNDYPATSDVAFPGNVNGVITVGAINNSGTIWSYSQRGTSMDLVAPTGNTNFLGDVTTLDRMGNLGYNNTNYMSNFGGTSAACPQVSGVAALLLSLNPALTEVQVKQILQQSATDMGTAGFDNTFGYGRVNAHAALLNAITLMNMSISGNTIVCSSNAYSVAYLPSGSTVVWTLSPHPSAIQIVNNVPVTNQCLVSNPYKYPAVMTLTATITLTCGGTVVLTKIIASDTNTTYQSGSYYQQACTAYNHSFPSQSGTLNGSSVFLYPGCTTEVSLSQMTGRTVSFISGPQPLSWYYSSSNSKLYLQLPTQSGPYMFSITGAGACYSKTLVFFAYSGYSLLISPNPTNGETSVTIEQASAESSFDYNAEWDIEVYDNLQNQKFKVDKIKGKSTTIQTNGWKEGVYIVRVKYKDEILTGKLVVKK